MTTSRFDSFRPPERRRRRRAEHRNPEEPRRKRGGQGSSDGGREDPVVPDAEFTSYYGRGIVKPAPWGKEVAAYLFLGGLAAGSALLAAGAQVSGQETLRRNSRFAALTGAGLGTVALIADLGRPERFTHMLRTFKITSPMSVGSWLLAGFSTAAGVAAVNDADRLTEERLPLQQLRTLLRTVEDPAGAVAGLLAPGLAAYTAVLLTNTATPTWAGARRELPFVFAGSAALAAGGLAMMTTPPSAAGPARRFALAGVVAELVAADVMTRRMDPTEAEPLREGTSGALVRWSRNLAVLGGVGTLFSGGSTGWARALAATSGAALVASSALNRFGVFEAGMVSAKDPKYTVEPQKRRLAKRQARGETGDSITTVR